MILLLAIWLLLVVMSGCSPTKNGADKAVPIVINEFMTSNRTELYLDEYGDADDWIELFNNGDSPFDAGGLSLSDDSTRLHRYTIPDTIVPPGGLLLVWADDEPQQGPWHAPFKLSAQNGEEIILTKGEDVIVDRIQFFLHNDNPLARVPDESYGRESDGSATWVQQVRPTPGMPNVGGRNNDGK